MHQSVAEVSQRMKLELQRHNYVTPTNYLELVSGYKKWASLFSLHLQMVYVCPALHRQAMEQSHRGFFVCVCVSGCWQRKAVNWATR